MRDRLLPGLRGQVIVAGVFSVFSLIGCVEGAIDGEVPGGEVETPVPTPSDPSFTDAGPLEVGADAPVVEETAPPPPPVDSTGYPADDPTAPNTDALSADLAEHLVITEIASYQSLKVPLARDGAPVPRKRWEKIWGTTAAEVPIVGGRDALLRIFVKPEAGFSPTTITARVKVQRKTAEGLQTKVFSATKSVTAASTDGDLGSTINVAIPASALTPDTSFGVVLNAPGTRAAPTGASPARYPTDGKLADLGVGAGGDVLKVVLVPMRYRGDGSGRLPDTSSAQVEIYRDQLFRRYPVAKVDVRVHGVIDYTSLVTKDNGIGDMLNVIAALHDSEHAADDEYYVGLLRPAEKFWDFCGSGCVAGLSFVGTPASVWWGYSGTDWAGGTGAHELGHAHGLPHAPCGTSGDGFWPADADHQSAKLGSWGWDPVEKKLFDPGGDPNPSTKSTLRDLMSYCGPTWIGDFNYAKLWHRVQNDNGVKAADFVGDAMESIFVDEAGHAKWESHAVPRRAWMAHGQPTTVTVVDERGAESLRTALYFPYDHLPGGRLLVPTDEGHRPQAIRHAGRLLTTIR